MKCKLDSSLTRVTLVKHEIDRLQDFLSSYQYNIIKKREEFEKSNKKKIDDLFQYLNKIITYNYNAALHILQQCKSEQQSQIDNVLVFYK